MTAAPPPTETLREGIQRLATRGDTTACHYCMARDGHRSTCPVADLLAALSCVEALASAVPGALELLAAEGYDGHFESGAPVSPEYERLAAAYRPFSVAAAERHTTEGGSHDEG